MSEVASSWLNMLGSTPPPKPKRPPAQPKVVCKTKTDKARAICKEMYTGITSPSTTQVTQRLVDEAKMSITTARSFLENWRNTQIPPR